MRAREADHRHPRRGPAGRRTGTRVGVPGLAALLVLLVATGTIWPATAGAQSGEDAAQKAAREIREARDRANAAAQEFFLSEAELHELEDRAAGLENEAEQLEATVAELQSQVESVAVNRFVSSGSGGIPLLTGIQAPQEQVQAEVFVDVLTNVSSDAFDQYDVASADLARTRDDLEAQELAIEQKQELLIQLQADAEAEVEHLREVEEQRLRDEAVREALAAQLAAEQAAAEEAAREAAAAQAAAQPNPAAVSTEAPAAPGVDSGGGDSGDSGDSEDTSGSDESGSSSSAPPTTAAPTTVAAPSGGSSGGTSGGRTGASGGGSTPAPAPPPPPVAGIVCPMPGSAYGDTWGAARSGGRSHLGVDMLAPRGTPIFAVAGGYATFKQTRLGGNSVSLAGDNGTRYFYAHLSGFEGSSRRVSQGELIGYNGDTGNASGTPHLHFEIHPGGGSAINPTPSVRAAGC